MQPVATKCEQIVLEIGTAKIKFHLGPLKGEERILEKALMSRGRFDCIRDYARGMIEVIDIKSFPAVIVQIKSAKEFTVVRVKNRFEHDYNAADSAGYRDYQLVLRTTDGWLVELQIIPRELLKLKLELGHSDYTEYRFLVEAGKRARRGTNVSKGKGGGCAIA